MTTATAQAGPLSSDHINYLILRYLQEAGHEASATAFYRDWRRPAEYRDPEDLPFAPAVQRHELVSVIQDGLYHDELLSRVRKGERRFNFMINGAGGRSRLGPAGTGKGRMDQMRRGEEEFPTPPPKRQRKGDERPQERQVNGAPAEPMELDAASPSVEDAEDDAEGASPAVQTPEPQIVEVPERYDSMDVAVQTDGKTGPKTSTMCWRAGKANATILHNVFSPAKSSRCLFTAGEGISQFHEMPDDFESGVDKISSMEDVSAGPGSVVTACAWHPDGHALAYAVDMARELGVAGKQERRQAIKVHDAKSSRVTECHSPPLLNPQGIVIALRYSQDGSYLLALRTNGSRSTAELWRSHDVSDSRSSAANATAWYIFDTRILDAAWTEKSTFWVCCEDGQLQKLRILSDQSNGVSTYDSTSARMHGLEVATQPHLDIIRQHLGPQPPSFDKVAAWLSQDQEVLIVVAAPEDHKLFQCWYNATQSTRMKALLDTEAVTAMAFRPTGVQDAETSGPLLATVLDSGSCLIWELNSSEAQEQTLVTCRLPDGAPGLALAWSPHGSYLAVAAVETLQIWETSSIVNAAARKTSSAPEALLTWRRSKSAVAKVSRNGEHTTNGNGHGHDDEPLLEPSLSWSADGESLALAVGGEIAVIRFRPPLRDGHADGTAPVR